MFLLLHVTCYTLSNITFQFLQSFIYYIGFLSSTKVNILFSDPNAHVNFKHGSIPSRDWGMPPPAEWTRKIGLNKIKLFCGMTNGQGFEAEKCNRDEWDVVMQIMRQFLI